MSPLFPNVRARAFAMLISGAFLISFSAVFVKLAHIAPAVSAFYRVFIGALILLAIARFRHDSFFPDKKALRLIIVAAVFFSMDLIFFHHSILIIGPGLATILGNFQVFYMAAFAILILKEKPTLKLLFAIPLAVAGLFLIVGIRWDVMSSLYKFGVLFGLLSGLCYAFYILSLRNTQTQSVRLSIFVNLALISALSAAILAGYILLITHNSFAIPDGQTWFAILGLGIVSQVLGWVLIARALPDLEVSVTGLILLLQPALSYVWDVLFFNHPVSLPDVTGAILALTAIYLGSTGRRKPRKTDKIAKLEDKEECIQC